MNDEKLYPSLSERVKATIIDAFCMVLFMIIFSYIFSQFDAVPTWVRKAAFAFVFFLYEPISVALFGATIGHSTVRIEVRKLEDESSKINFITAILRFVIKSFLGWISLLTISGSDKRQAIHDKLAQSVVVFSKN